ncbi:MAG: hypothetical protein IT554_02935 [Sphingomonadaceae bacterium]|nr:hypothetical protein [Sphingomonadaceae bacterium]
MTWDAWKAHAAIGRIRFKRHRARETRRDAKAIVKAQIAMTERLEAVVAHARFMAIEPLAFASASQPDPLAGRCLVQSQARGTQGAAHRAAAAATLCRP